MTTQPAFSPKIWWRGRQIESGLHPKTIRDAKLAPVRAILQWAVDNHRLPVNPTTRLTIGLKTRAADSKRGFDDNEAAKILTAARAETDPVKRWVPLLGAYSGARLSEICQLRGLRMKPLRFGGIPRAEAPLFLLLAKDWTQVVGDPLAKPIDAGFGMFPGTCHRKGHVYHQCVPLWRPEPLILR